MKKTIKFLILFAFIIAFVCCFCGCSKKGNAVKDRGETATETQTKTEIEYPIYVELDSSGVREKIVKYMTSMAEIKWTPNRTIHITADNGSWGVNMKYEKGMKYMGLPYTRANSDFEGFSEYVKNGVFIPEKNSDYENMVGANCSSACNVSWKKALLNETGATYTYVPGYSKKLLVPVGEYKYPEYNSDTIRIIGMNNRDVMFEAYAKCNPADAVVKWSDESSAGHCRMVAAKAVIKRNAKGKISGSASYLTMTEQTNGFVAAKSNSQTCWRVKKIYTFEDLYSDNYIPVTHRVFANESIEQHYFKYSDGNTSEDIVNGLKGDIESNYAVHAVEFVIYDKSGEIVKKYYDLLDNVSGKVNLKKYTFALGISELPAGEYTYTLSAENILIGKAELCKIEFTK